MLKLDRSHGLVGGTTVVFDNDFNALYLSKEIIPYFDEKRLKESANCPIFQHVGVYAYKSETLLNYNSWKESNLEVLEGLEQLRFLENGCSIKCVLVDSKGRTYIEAILDGQDRLLEKNVFYYDEKDRVVEIKKYDMLRRNVSEDYKVPIRVHTYEYD